MTEQHAEGEEHDVEDHEDDHEEGPTMFSNDADEFGLILDLGNDSLSQKLVFQNMNLRLKIVLVKELLKNLIK